MGGTALIAAIKYMYVCACGGGGEEGEGGVCGCGCDWDSGCDCVCVCGCDCMGEEGVCGWGSLDCTCRHDCVFNVCILKM